MKDIYFDTKYGFLYEEIEKGSCEEFKLNCQYGSVYHMFIKREIPFNINNQTFYDLTTPYGYGGPIIQEYKNGNKNNLLKEFNIKFKEYCAKNNIVSEFIRFHPLFNNAKEFNSVYTLEHIRKTVGTSISNQDSTLSREFSKSARKIIRKAINIGVSYKVTKKPNNLDNFMDIYYSTMKRNNASEYYYFSKEYFYNCLDNFKENIILVEVIYDNKVIASGLYFVYGEIIHAHLSGTLNEYLYLSPAYVIKYATVQWAEANGIKIIHYGGGTSNKPDDSLYQFKKKFGKKTEFDFYVGKRIWNDKVYNKLCESRGINPDKDFFPSYRA
ncbi:peptidoglycan bridge formation glycyltransferase FemA/FemB family protein [Salipaludibacillus sp. CUR1]|uniref:peptidoglycan bridge formation glycyltransferase FemA/FemB family protein n=1 Tax=Salipaludibacillus sp. CUR1 TaxID=2820003 RepID=UPI001E4B157E|nr:peptidoglycan bridge formation glycyltransferase FemA/FemB family protein [Salipaludibacillus sp. CUR1]MCE7791182.1 peptidoglycan bridge formation glycyltransferase FemA/FemB family protein [Salipaludibacillus sp. CUR1]